MPKLRSNMMSKPFSAEISKSLNFLITLNLLPGDLDTYTEAKRLNFLNGPLKTYYKNNRELVSLFFNQGAYASSVKGVGAQFKELSL